MNAFTPRRRPRGITLPGGLRDRRIFAMAADGDPGAVAQLQAFLREAQPIMAAAKATGTEIVELQKAVDEINVKLSAFALNGAGGEPAQRDPNTKHFVNFMRLGDGPNDDLSKFIIKATLAAIGQPQAAMSVGSQPDGGFTVLPDVEKSITTIARDISPLRTLCAVMQSGSAELKRVLDIGGMDAGWVGEKDPRTETNTSQLEELTFPSCEVYAMPKATQSLLDDSYVDVAAWFAASIATKMAAVEGTSFVSGNGVKQPMGFLQIPTELGEDFARTSFNTLQRVECGSTTPSDDQLINALIALSMKLRTMYRANAKWLMNRSTATRVRQLRDENGTLLWSTDYGRIAEGAPDRLLGFPVVYCEDMPSIGVNTFPIAFADWSQAYLIVDRMGIRTLRDPYTAKPYVLFYTTKRVGGGPLDRNAIKLLKIA